MEERERYKGERRRVTEEEMREEGRNRERRKERQRFTKNFILWPIPLIWQTIDLKFPDFSHKTQLTKSLSLTSITYSRPEKEAFTKHK